MKRPLAHDPNPNPAIKTDRTIETIAVVTPNCAIESRSQTISYRTLQKPEIRKKTKYQGKENLPQEFRMTRQRRHFRPHMKTYADHSGKRPTVADRAKIYSAIFSTTFP